MPCMVLLQVTLVHSGDRLLPALNAKVGAMALSWLQSKGVKVLLNDKVTVPQGVTAGASKVCAIRCMAQPPQLLLQAWCSWQVFTAERSAHMACVQAITANGVEVEYSLAIVATGITPNTSFMAKELSAALGPKGAIKVRACCAFKASWECIGLMHCLGQQRMCWWLL